MATELLQPCLFAHGRLLAHGHDGSRHHQSVSTFSGTRSHLRVFLLGWILILSSGGNEGGVVASRGMGRQAWYSKF